MTTDTIQAVRRSVTVAAPIDRAFSVFTASMTSWWPADHKIGRAALAETVVELTKGGRWYERGVDGTECDWGHVLAVEPPTRLLLSWQINEKFASDPDPAHASEVEVRFTDLGAGQTRVDLEHRHLERHGEGATAVHDGVAEEGGWQLILDRFATAVAAA